MRPDKKCVECGKLMPNAHYLKKYCSKECLIKVRKRRNRMKTEIKRIRNAEFDSLPEKEKTIILMDARADIMRELNNGASFFGNRK